MSTLGPCPNTNTHAHTQSELAPSSHTDFANANQVAFQCQSSPVQLCGFRLFLVAQFEAHYVVSPGPPACLPASQTRDISDEKNKKQGGNFKVTAAKSGGGSSSRGPVDCTGSALAFDFRQIANNLSARLIIISVGLGALLPVRPMRFMSSALFGSTRPLLARPRPRPPLTSAIVLQTRTKTR